MCSSCREAARSARRTQAVERARGDLVAFSDANVAWEQGALSELVAPFADERVGYVCGTVALVNERGSNQEGLYWRYEMAIRRLESRLRSVTGGNGAIYATRRDAYVIVDPIMGHDLSFPFNMVKRGWLAVYAPAARGSEKMVPTIEGEFARKRRMMSHGWPIVIRGGMLSPRGYDPIYALMIFSHRVLRYLSPFLHLIALGLNIALIGDGWVYVVTLALQLALLAGALLAPVVPARPLLVARYYVLTTASLAAGLWDWLRARDRASAGSRRRGPDDAPRVRHRGRPDRLGAHRAAGRAGGARSQARVARVTRSTRRCGWAATGDRSRSSSCERWCTAPSSPAPGWRSPPATPAITRDRLAAAPLLAG